MSKVISVVNMKGGVGKTTLAVNSTNPKGRVPRVYPWVNVAMAI